MQQVTDIDKSYSFEEYLKLDETGTLRHEFYHGKIFTMPGKTLLHNEICIRLLMHLTSLLYTKGFKTYIENVKVQIESEEIYLYPDIVVMNPEEENIKSNKNYVIHRPFLIAEVLSDSTRKYDLINKFIQYQKIFSLRFYLLVEPEKHVVIFYEKDGSGEWTGKTFTEMDEVIALPLLDAQITLADIYS